MREVDPIRRHGGTENPPGNRKSRCRSSSTYSGEQHPLRLSPQLGPKSRMCGPQVRFCERGPGKPGPLLGDPRARSLASTRGREETLLDGRASPPPRSRNRAQGPAGGRGFVEDACSSGISQGVEMGGPPGRRCRRGDPVSVPQGRSRTRQGVASSTPGGIRTPDQWIRSPPLYPSELRAQAPGRTNRGGPGGGLGFA